MVVVWDDLGSHQMILFSRQGEEKENQENAEET